MPYYTVLYCTALVRDGCIVTFNGFTHQRSLFCLKLDSPKQATGLEEVGLGLGLVLVGDSITEEGVEKPIGQVEHLGKDPTEHLTDSAPQLVTLQSESASGSAVVHVYECTCVSMCECECAQTMYICMIE